MLENTRPSTPSDDLNDGLWPFLARDISRTVYSHGIWLDWGKPTDFIHSQFSM